MPLPSFPSERQVFLETTKSEHGHGGPGWEFGSCLWAPKANAIGREYKIMHRPSIDDLVLHNYHYAIGERPAEFYLCGYSRVSKPVKSRIDEPPSPGPWKDRDTYYRIDLDGFTSIEHPLSFRTFVEMYGDTLRDEITYHKTPFFPFTINAGAVRPNQGMYLSIVTEMLYNAFVDALGVELSPLYETEKQSVHRAYSEGTQMKRELSFFVRNPVLARDAKKHYDNTCQLCGYRPVDVFGSKFVQVGIECHHLKPFSERNEVSSSSALADVTVLCANCHRLVHSKRPAFTLDQVRQFMRPSSLPIRNLKTEDLFSKADGQA
jgi:hypothetical protein